jgi:predicted DsbA family dithiol-disulfide isomerase
MKIEIWSDIMCPFCYIAKRKFEKALAQFPHPEDVEVQWHSYQQHPELQHDPGKDIYDFLVEVENMSRDQAIQMNAQVTTIARNVGLDFHFNDIVVANTLDAHRLLQLAALHGLQEEAVEHLFAACFTEAKNLEDPKTLLQLGTDIGLEGNDIQQMLSTDAFVQEVKEDQLLAKELDIEAVPFFSLNRQYGISGPQPTEMFLQAFQKVWLEEHPDKGPADVQRKKTS